MATLTLSNGVKIPYLGLGTGGKYSTPSELECAVRSAIDIGYRHIDTAFMYDNEAIIGKAIKQIIKSGIVTREELFITTKLPPSSNRPELVESTLKSQLENLQMNYVDLYLIHSPTSTVPTPEGYNMYSDTAHQHDSVDLSKTWKAMESIYEKGLAKAIGLSNFNVEQIQQVYQSATIKPHNLQIEVHVHFPQRELHTLCTSLNISVTAYAPLGCPSKRGENGWPSKVAVDDPVIMEMAEKYKKTPAQILLRHLIQRQIIVIPKSINANRLRENFNIFDFEISAEDMIKVNDIAPRCRLYKWSGMGLETHPDYPFTEILAGRPNEEH